MIDIVLDTNIYRENPKLDNLNFKAMERLSIADTIRLHVPYVVEREFQTQQREIYQKSLEKARNGLSDLQRKDIPDDIKEKISLCLTELESHEEKILTSIENKIIKWFENIKASRHPLSVDQAKDALEAYFQGKPPLKAIKIRDDIPDSFIVQAIKAILKNNKPLYLVAGDKKVRESFSGDESVKTYKRLSDFIESEEIQDELKDLDLLDNFYQYIDAFQKYEEEYKKLSNGIAKTIGEAIVDHSIGSSEIPDDNDVIINGYYEAENVELDYGEILYYGRGSFGIPFSLSIKVSTYYYIPKSELISMPDKSISQLSISDYNEYYFEVEGDFDVEVKGIATIEIQRENIDFHSFNDFVDANSIDIDSIESIEHVFNDDF